MAADPVFLLLRTPTGWIPGNRWKNILGSVVQNCLSPLTAKIPKDPWTCDEASYYEITLDQFVLGKRLEKQRTSRSSLRGLFTLAADQDELDQLDLRGQRVVIHRLKQIDDVWRQLGREHPELLTQARTWYETGRSFLGRSNGPYWVTGVLTCQKVTIAATQIDAQRQEKRGEIPIGTLGELGAASYGLSINYNDLVNIAGERSRMDENSTCFVGQGDVTYMFGLEVRQILLKKHSIETFSKQLKSPPDRTSDTSPEDEDEGGDLSTQKLNDLALGDLEKSRSL